MPCYDYINEKTGERVEIIVPMSQRDSVPGHKRILIPPHINTVGFAENPHTMEYGVRQGLKDMEERFGRDRIEREGRFKMNTLRETWGGN